MSGDPRQLTNAALADALAAMSHPLVEEAVYRLRTGRAGSRIKYPLETLAVGESLMIEQPRRHLRGSLYNRAEALGIRISCRAKNLGLKVERIA